MKRKLTISKSFPIGINLGCGTKFIDDTIGIDIRDYAQEVIWDVREGLPLADKSVNAVHIYHFIEHLTYKEVYELFLELYRICINKTLIHIRVPPCDGPRGYSPTHLSFWDEDKLKGFINNFPDAHNQRIKMFGIEWMACKEDLICLRVEVLS